MTAPDKSFYPDTLNKRLDYGAANLLTGSCRTARGSASSISTAVREVIDGGDTGTAHRLQFAIRFNLPS